MAVLGGGAAPEAVAEVGDGGLVGAEGLDPGAGAVGEAGDLAEGDALGLDLGERLAAVEHGLVEPEPNQTLRGEGADRSSITVAAVPAPRGLSWGADRAGRVQLIRVERFRSTSDEHTNQVTRRGASSSGNSAY